MHGSKISDHNTTILIDIMIYKYLPNPRATLSSPISTHKYEWNEANEY